MAATVQFEDAGLQRLRDTLAGLRKLKVRVGYQDEDGKAIHPGSDIRVAHIAAIMEFGWPPHIPARSFMRSTIEEHAEDIRRFQEEQIATVILEKATPVAALSRVGAYVCRLIRSKLENASSWAKPLDPDTVEAKGHTTPLDETSVLIRNLGWRVSSGREVFARGK